MKTCVGIVGIAVTYAALAVPAPVAAKAGFSTSEAAQYLGQTHVVSIGIPPRIRSS